ncbi:MAG: starvation-inducible DNA-binding protein [Mycobacterium sp.]|jgi:starvation-inducible DNA-binding protein|nr:starvation-inducible DNA-binding protein [Mycobacterium sp.]
MEPIISTAAAPVTANRRTVDQVRVFQAPDSLVHNLQKLLVDLIELHLQGKQAHWNLVGTNFRDLHLQLDEIVDAAREAADAIAERMRALDAVPDGRTDTVASTTSVPAAPAGLVGTSDIVDIVADRIYATVHTARTIHDEVDAKDPSTADLLHAIITDLEKQAWMLKSENGKA